jgi:hypothetical protein
MTQGLDGTFYHLNHSKKDHGVKVNRGFSGLTLQEIIMDTSHSANDSLYDFFFYVSEYSLDSLIDSLIDSGVFKNENFTVYPGDFDFIRKFRYIYGEDFSLYNMSTSYEMTKCMLMYDDENRGF